MSTTARHGSSPTKGSLSGLNSPTCGLAKWGTPPKKVGFHCGILPARIARNETASFGAE